MPVHNERLDQDNRGSHPLQGKVAVVTGGAGAIGSAVVARLGPEGVRVVAVDQSRPTDPATGVNYLRGDIAHPVTAQHAVATAEAAFGGLDLLVNAATAWHRGGLTDTDITCWNRLLAVNLTGTLLACQAAVPAMARRGGGVIVNLGSTRPLDAPDQLAYAVYKDAVAALTQRLAAALAPRGIRVGCVHQGTTSAEGARPDKETAAAAVLPLLSSTAHPAGQALAPGELSP